MKVGRIQAKLLNMLPLWCSAAVGVFNSLILAAGTQPHLVVRNASLADWVPTSLEKTIYFICKCNVSGKPQEKNQFWVPPGPASLCHYSWFSETRNKEASFCFLLCYHFLCLFGWTTEQKHQMWPEECQQSLATRMWANLEEACVLSKANFRLKLRSLHEHQFQHFTPKNTFYCPQISSCPTFHHTQLQKSHLSGVSNLNMTLLNS